MGELEPKEILTEDIEEYQLLEGVCRSFGDQQSDSICSMSGNATQKVIQEYLIEKKNSNYQVEPKSG